MRFCWILVIGVLFGVEFSRLALMISVYCWVWFTFVVNCLVC